MKNTNKKLTGKIKVVNSSFTGGNITKYSGLNVVAKFIKRHKINQNFNNIFPTIWHNATKFSTVQILLSIVFASLAGVNRIKRIENFTQDL